MRTGIRSEGGAGIFCAMLRIRRMPQMSARQLKYEGALKAPAAGGMTSWRRQNLSFTIFRHVLPGDLRGGFPVYRDGSWRCFDCYCGRIPAWYHDLARGYPVGYRGRPGVCRHARSPAPKTMAPAARRRPGQVSLFSWRWPSVFINTINN